MIETYGLVIPQEEKTSAERQIYTRIQNTSVL